MADRPLHRILTLHSVLLAVLPFIVIATLVAAWLYPQIRAEIESQQIQLTTAITSQMEHYLTTSVITLKGIAALDLEDDPEDPILQRILDTQLQVSESLGALYIAGPNGHVAAVAVPGSNKAQRQDLLGLDLSRNSLFRDVMVYRRPIWSDTFLSVVGGGLSVALAVPSSRRVIIGEIDLSQLRKPLNQISTAKEQIFFVIDRRGQVIADPDGRYTAQQLNISNIPLVKEALSASKPVLGRLNFNGHPMIGAIARTALIDWHVLGMIPENAAYLSMWTTIRIFTAALFVAVLAGIMISVALARRLAHRFEILTTHAQRIASGEDISEWPKANITEFKELAVNLQQMAGAIREREAYNRILFADSPISLVVIDPITTQYIDCNDAALKVFALFTRNEIIGKTIPYFSAPTQYDGTKSETAAKKHLQACLEKGFNAFEWRHQKPGGELWHGEINASLFKRGEQTFIQFSIQDITQRKQAEANLIDSEAKFRQVMETIHEVFWLGSADWKQVYYISPAYQEVWGRSCEALYQNPKSRLDAVVKEDLHAVQSAIISTDGWLSGEIRFPDYRILRPDGSMRWIKERAFPIINESGKTHRVAGIAEDISDHKHAEEERKNLEARLAHSQKLEAIGTLAGGIAHDFNNILFPIMGYAEMMLAEVSDNSSFKPYLEKVLTAAKRAKALVQQILTYSRQTDQELKPLSIHPIIEEVIKLLRSSLPVTIEIKKNIRADCGPVLADATQIHQIVMNLATNAYHAMQETGGELEVSLKEVTLSLEDLHGKDMTPGSYNCLTVSDTGIGMEKKIIERIFEPYFTTKERGKGTGLGLSIIYGIVKKYRGDIQAYSEPGRGSVFHVYLPVIKDSGKTEAAGDPALIPKGTERILLVDDEESIVQMEQLLLEGLGYSISAQKSSTDALNTFRAAPHNFDLVITDMTMPNMTGTKLSLELKKIRPDILIILCTGFSEQVDAEKASALGINGFLEKPVRRIDFAKMIRQVLDGK